MVVIINIGVVVGIIIIFHARYIKPRLDRLFNPLIALCARQGSQWPLQRNVFLDMPPNFIHGYLTL